MKKKIIYFFVLVCIAIFAWIFRVTNSPIRGSEISKSQDPSKTNFPSGRDSPNAIATNADSKDNYYARREAMIRFYHGDSQIDGPLAIVKSGKGNISELLTALDRVQRNETVSALPYIVKLLENENQSIRSKAAEVLCFFGDFRGFKFILAERKKEGGFDKWQSVLAKVLIDNENTAYNSELKKMMEQKNVPGMSQQIEAYELAKLLARLGDTSGMKIISTMFRNYPPASPESVLSLKHLSGANILEIAKELRRNGVNEDVKEAADILLVKQGDIDAQQRIIEAAKEVIDLAQPQSELTSPNGPDENAIDSWNNNAVFAFENGLEAVDSKRSIPILQDIAIHAQNVRFSRTAIELLAKPRNNDARAALWNVARSLINKKRPFEDTLFTTAGKALTLFDDSTSNELATTMFSGDKRGMEASKLIAEARGWDGLFKLDLFY